jgi:hypothetical protein
MLQLLTAKIGSVHSRFVRIQFDGLNGQENLMVCIVDVEPSTRPAFLRWNDQIHFYKRTGNTSEPLNPIAQHEYIQARYT